MENKYKYLNRIINEALEEVTTDFETFDQFKKGSASPNAFFVYSQVDKGAIPNIKKNGTEGAKEWLNTMVYGRGLYTVMSYKDCIGYSHGDAMVKYLVKKGAFDNFLIFDMGIRKKLYQAGILTVHEKISTTIRRLFSPEDFAMLERYYGKGLNQLDEEVASCDHSHQSNYYQERFLSIIRKDEGNIKLHPNLTYHSEKRLDISNVDGWCYHSGYGDVAIFRTMDLLAPYSYGIREAGWSGSWPAEKDFKYCIGNDEDFNNINISVDAFRRARKDYPDTKFTEKTVCGFSLVRNGRKYNLLNARTNKYFSPIDFDACQVFDPLQGTTQFSIFSPEEGTFDFRLTSVDRGKEIQLLYRLRDEENMEGGWEEISYKDFLEVMEEFKQEQMQDKNKAAINEVFTHKNFDAFNKSLSNSNNVFIYRATSPETARLEFLGGSNMEFSGTGGDSSLYYGLGVYCVRDTVSLFCNKYGQGVVKFLLKDGFKDFIIFDNDLRAKVDPGQSVYDEIVKLVPRDLFNAINNHLLHNDAIYYQIRRSLQTKGVDAFKNIEDIEDYHRRLGKIKNTAKYAKAFIMTLLGRHVNDPVAPAIRDEKLLSKTKIRGMVFTGADDGHVVMVRDFNSLMPVDYSTDGGRTWKGGFNEKSFNKINQQVDPYFLYRGEYENTGYRTKPICGFSMVSGRQGYNYKDIWFHRPLLPMDADKATPFDALTRTAHFEMFGEEFEVTTDEDYNISLSYNDDGTMTECSYDEFMEFIEVAKEQGMTKNKKFYENNLLNPANDRRK